ncbi:hypothetical protein MWU52_05370 [Jannaschia sp. S6380]|uniref:hypothetical protein n=1 Tax=Jannaschia sp. S6380 TaxID=2926408 RepID=UPI001FF600AF|nr:hypothetical protein [Jannaschia sp. S6380]MCK0166976.1 hypothetical protein [Jannaschia sp. S6380]
MDRGQSFGAVDFGFDGDRVTEEAFRHDPLRVPNLQEIMRGFFLRPGKIFGPHGMIPKNFRVDIGRDLQVAAKPIIVPMAVSEFDNRESGQVDPEDVNPGQYRAFLGPAFRTSALANAHVSDVSFVFEAALVAVEGIALTIRCRPDERPAICFGFIVVTFVTTNLAIDIDLAPADLQDLISLQGFRMATAQF